MYVCMYVCMYMRTVVITFQSNIDVCEYLKCKIISSYIDILLVSKHYLSNMFSFNNKVVLLKKKE